MMHLNHFVWRAQYTLGFEVIDHQHMEFLQIMDDLYEAIRTDAGRDKLLQIFDHLETHTKAHFSTEEMYFKKFDYDPVEAHAHIEDHNKFVADLAEMKNKLVSGEHQFSFQLLDILEDHLIFHLADMDKKYIDCFREHGLK